MRIIPNQGVCDPHVHVWGGKAYLFSTHDRGPGQPIFHMDDWRIYSSDDLLNWKLAYTFRPEDTFLGKCEECYAVDAAERNGKYYLYFSHGQECTGAAVSEYGPAGPYQDALGKPLLPAGLADTPSYDPTVFIDDDPERTPYIMWGFTCFGKKYDIARLNEDMVSLAEEPRAVEIENTWPSDACWISKFGDTYYLSTHRSWYATSKSVYGPYTYRGLFLDEPYNDHGTFFTYHNQTYYIYGVPEDYHEEPFDHFYRTTKIVYAHFRDSGEIAVDPEIVKAGVGHYDAGWNRIAGAWYFAASDGLAKKENGRGFEIRGIKDGSYLCYPKVANMPQNALLYLNGMPVPGKRCAVEIREGSPWGRVLGFCKIAMRDGVCDVPCRLENGFGSHDLCFVFRGEGEDLFGFGGFRFEQVKD